MANKEIEMNRNVKEQRRLRKYWETGMRL